MPGSGGGGDSDTTQQVIPWEGAQPHLKSIFADAGSLYQTGGPGYYPGSTVAPIDPLQTQANQHLLNYAYSGLPQQISSARNAWTSALGAPDVASNPYVQQMMAQNATNLNRNFSENLMPQIRRSAVSGGTLGGSRQGVAEGIAARGTSEALANANNQLMMDAWGKGLAAQQGALGMSGNMASLGAMPMNLMQQIGQFNRGIDQERLGADVQRWDYNQNLPWNTLNQYNSIVQGAPWGSQTSASGSSSPLAGMLGGAALGGAAAPLLGSTAMPSWLSSAGFTGWGAPLAIGGALLGGLLS